MNIVTQSKYAMNFLHGIATRSLYFTMSVLFIIVLSLSHIDFYHKFRLQHGIAEGIDEIPPGNCFPLEYNLDYLNGGIPQTSVSQLLCQP